LPVVAFDQRVQIGFGTGVASFASIVGLARQKIGALIGAVGCRVPFCQMFRQCNGLGRFQNTGTLGVDAFGLQTIFQLIFSWQGYIEWVVTVGKDSTQTMKQRLNTNQNFSTLLGNRRLKHKKINKVVPQMNRIYRNKRSGAQAGRRTFCTPRARFMSSKARSDIRSFEINGSD